MYIRRRFFCLIFVLPLVGYAFADDAEVSDHVVVEAFGPFVSHTKMPPKLAEPRLRWHQDALAFVRFPNRYDSWGVRDDWADGDRKVMLLCAKVAIDLPEGDYQLMIRSRGLSRLLIDDEPIGGTRPQRNRTGAHHVVDPLPEVPVAGMRPHYMNDHEQIVDYRSPGGRRSIQFEMLVGGRSFSLEFGETCVAIARKGEMFRVLAVTQDYPLTDEGWTKCEQDEIALVQQVDCRNRRTAGAEQEDFWRQRHDHARATLRDEADAKVTLDQLIEQRIVRHNRLVADAPPENADEAYYRKHVLPILNKHCIRCHGEKQKGEYSIRDREHLLKGGESEEPAIIPGDPDEGYLVELISAEGDEDRMPPEGVGLNQEQIGVVRKWITDGAVMPPAKLVAVKTPPTVDDYAFMRRVFIDTVGVVPTLAEIEEFFADTKPGRRARLIDRLLADPRWADNWVGYWQDALAENPNLLKPMLNNTGPFRFWIFEALDDNKSLDRFVTELIMMRGSKWSGGAAGFGVATQNDVPMAAKAHVISHAFLGVELKCARCHDAPYHDWKQSDLFQMAAMFERKDLKLPKTSTVPLAFFENQPRKALIPVTLKAGAHIKAEWPFTSIGGKVDTSLLTKPDDLREQLAAHVTTSRRFAEVMSNRIWSRLMGAGIVDPVHDWQHNPPSDARLLSHLADQLIFVGYDQKELVRRILNSKAYQRQAISRVGETRYFQAPYRRRMSAEQIVDSALHAVGQQMRTEKLTLDLEGTFPPDKFKNFGYPRHAWEFTTLANERDRPSLALPRAQAIADVLQAFGWRNSRQEPISYRAESANLVQPGALANGTFGGWLTRLSDESELTEMMLQDQTVEQLVDRLFLRLLTRRPEADEQSTFVRILTPGFNERLVPADQVPEQAKPRRFRRVSWSNHLHPDANTIKIEMEKVARRGPPPTGRLNDAWRQRAEDAVWSLLNSPEMIVIP